LICFYLQQVYTKCTKFGYAGIEIRSVRSTPLPPLNPTLNCPSLSLTHFIARPARQSRSRHTLYSMRYAPGGRGHTITNWQCTSHAPPSEVSGPGEVYRAEPGTHMHNSKVPNNQCSISNVHHYFRAHYQYIIIDNR